MSDKSIVITEKQIVDAHYMTDEKDNPRFCALPLERRVSPLPCPFCGKPVNLNDDDTLYPTGQYWRVDDGIKHYIQHKDRQADDNSVWGMHCSATSGGCGAEIHGDSKQETVDKWNKWNERNLHAERKAEIESLRARNDKSYADYINERILRYAAEAERDAETERCAKIASDYGMSPVVGKAIAALIMEGR